MNNTSVKGEITQNGYTLSINNKTYSAAYEKEIWNKLENKKSLIENISYGRTAPLLTIFKKIEYNTSLPYFKRFIDYGVIRDLPRIADMKGIDTAGLIEDFKNAEAVFKDSDTENKVMPDKITEEGNALLGMSFGKDSLLSLGLADEVGLDTKLVFLGDMIDYNPKEYAYKKAIIDNFNKKFRRDVCILADNTDSVYYDTEIKDNFSSFDEINAMFLFTLELIPIALTQRSKYIIFGNEQNHNDSYTNKDNFKTYSSGDQSSEYMEKLNEGLFSFTSSNNQMLSLVEPIYNIAEVKVLSSRYPQFIPFIMSCSSKKIGESRWCFECPMCAKFYLFTRALGLDVESFGLKNNMFRKEFWNLYPLFNKTPSRPYEKPKEMRDEQLLAFYLAYKNKANGELIELFKKDHLDEAREREEELHKKFFGIHNSVSMPSKIKGEISKIYREELADFS